MIISIINNKGGVGKTTCSTILSELAARQGKVLAVDICGQQNMIDNFMVDNKLVFDRITTLSSPDKTPDESKLKGYEYVIIDTPPNTQSSVIRKVIGFSDVIVVPFMLQKHAIYGLDEVFAIVPDDKDGFLICVASGQLGEYEKSLLTIVENNFADTLVRWPLLARVEKNIGLHRQFDFGLRQDEKKIFERTFKQIKRI